MQRYGTAVPLGAGSFAEVYRCFDTQLQRTVALKLLRGNEPEPAERMFREARAQAKIDHEGVCKVYETGWRDGRPFIAMQYVEGEDLLSASRRLCLKSRLKLMIKVIEAIDAAHRQGLVHRDIKPDNVLVNKDSRGRLRPVVVDFGLALDSARSAGRMTRVGEPVGTPAFMSPEQAAGRLGQIDPRTDVYGLGATLYAVLTGRPPFEGTGTTDLLIKALESEPVRPRLRRPDLPLEIEQIVLKCLEKNRADRYPSARALADDLARFLGGEPVDAGRSGWWHPLRKGARKHRRGLAFICAVAGVAVMAFWAVEQQAREASRRIEYEQRFLQLSNDLDWGLRAAQMSSPHDITPSREWVRQRVRRLEQELGDLEPSGLAAAHYAIGRAYSALHEDDLSRRHLESAWRLGHQSPEVGYFLGLVIGRQYEDALERVRHVSEPELRRIYLEDLVTRYRDPAKTYLEVGRQAESVSVEYVEALIDFYEERYDRALDKLSRVREHVPWLYEARVAEGRVLRRLAELRFEESRLEAALDLYYRAEDAYRGALASASSDPQIYAALCRLMSRRIEAELDWSIPPTDPDLDEHLEICEQGLEVGPSSARAHRAAAWAYELRARVSVDRSWEPERARDAIGRAESLAMEAVRLRGEEADGHATLAGIRMTRGRLASRIGDPGDELEIYLSADQSLRQALARTAGPKDLLRLDQAVILQLIAGVKARRWLPGDGDLREAAALIQDELSLAPRSFTLQCQAGLAELSLAVALRRQGKRYEAALDQAERSYGLCLELNEKYHWAFIGLAEIAEFRAAADCLDGRAGGRGPAEARRLVEEVLALDPGFMSGGYYQMRFWATEARCKLMTKRSPQPQLQAMSRLADEIDRSGQDTAFWRSLVDVMKARRLLTSVAPVGSRQRIALAAVFEAQLNRGDPLANSSSISDGLYRIDRLLWMSEAARELGRPTETWMDEAGELIQGLAARSEAVASSPELQAQSVLLTMMQRRDRRGRTVASDLRACESGLRELLERRPFMALHLAPWLHRLESLHARLKGSPTTG